MIESLFPVLPALFIAHAVMTIVIANLLSSEADGATVSAKAFPA